MEFFKILNYYSRKDIQDELLNLSRNREFIPKFDENYGKRPDIIQYSRDILESVKRGATSFHISEEQWSDPLSLKTGMTKSQLDSLRLSWDLVIDIDFEVFECSRIITMHVIKALKDHGIKNVFCKFSGNRGFHILIPFESFPETIKNYKTKDLFPDAPKAILSYLNNYIDNEENNFKLSKEIMSNRYFQDYLKINKKTEKDFIQEICTKCKKPKVNEEKIEFVCPHCNRAYLEDPKVNFKKCSICKKFAVRIDEIKTKCFCGNRKFAKKINISLDSVLISSRHLFRAPYALNEKSELISLPLNAEKILDFDRENAKPENIKEIRPFIDKTKIVNEEAKKLLQKALEYQGIDKEKEHKEFETPKEALKIQNFPPCVLKGLDGMEDGKKRFLFILLNFLKSSGYDYNEISDLVKKWNSKNKPPLKEGYILSQINWHKRQKQVLPPNCPSHSNLTYYTDLNICHPDSFCKFIKNPAQYTIKKSRIEDKK